jgi:uncharacterized cupin superfamily protein
MTKPTAIVAIEAAPRAKATNLPPPFDVATSARIKRPLGDVFGLKNFGVNLTTIPPGAISALLHRHTAQDELVYIVEGHPTLITESGETVLAPGMCAGFPAGGTAHCLVNRTDQPVLFIEIGDRSPLDDVEYPQDDLHARTYPDGSRAFLHKDGTRY